MLSVNICEEEFGVTEGYSPASGYTIEEYIDVDFVDYYHPDGCRIDEVITNLDEYRAFHVIYRIELIVPLF